MKVVSKLYLFFLPVFEQCELIFETSVPCNIIVHYLQGVSKVWQPI